jgi:uncharacterized protein (DUF1778 family)
MYTQFMAEKTARLNLRVSRVDSELFRAAAVTRDESLSEFIVESGRERAERILADRDRFVLDDERWTAFNAAVDRPAEVRSELVELFARTRPE